MLTHYLRIPTDSILKSPYAAGIAANMLAAPVFIDDPHPALGFPNWSR
jgi:hypothetical protein